MLGRWISATVVEVIRLYQRWISVWLPRRCKYEPTCSAYALSAVRRFGAPRGVVLAAWRVIRCNPFSHGGYDPVEAQTVFRNGPRLRAQAQSGGEAPAAGSHP